VNSPGFFKIDGQDLGPSSIAITSTGREVMRIDRDGKLTLDVKDSDEAAQVLKSAWERLMATSAPASVPTVTGADVIAFLESACRNWLHVPSLSIADIEDVRVELERFARKHTPHHVEVERLRAALEHQWHWPCPDGSEHCCCCNEECCGCDRPRSIEPDWQNAETCIENVMDAYATSTTFSEYGPVDTVVRSGDLMVVLSLAGAAFHARAALAQPKAGDK
jgi:hypothetical protein